jgi:signal transduction histidine kinase
MIVWSIAARTRRVRISNVPPRWDAGTPLDSWLKQVDLWSAERPGRLLVELGRIVGRSTDGCEHRVLGINGDTLTLCSRIDAGTALDRLAFLGEVSTFLSASTDIGTLATAASRLAVPQLADWCLLRFTSTAGSARRIWVGHADAAQERRIHQAVRRRQFPCHGGATWFGAGFTLTIDARAGGGDRRPGQPATDVGADPSSSGSDDLGLASEITVDLVGRAARLGKLSLASKRGGRRYGIFDVMMAMDFAQRISTAIEQAVLVRRTLRAARQRDQLLATVSHDLRNPLTAILAGTQGLLTSAGGSANPNDQRRIQAIRRSAERMNRLAEDLLTATQLERGGIPLRPARHSVAALMREVGELFEPLAAQRAQTLDLAVPDPDLLIHCDADRILQVLSNLLGNALKFTPDGGHIGLSAAMVGDQVRFSITDDGPGIRPHELSRVFDAHWQAEPRDYGGVGLGLAIAKELVTAHGGKIWVESRRGAGATFLFTLPIDREDQSERRDTRSVKRSRTPVPPLLYTPPPDEGMVAAPRTGSNLPN